DNSLIGVVLDRFGTDVIIQKTSEDKFRIRHEAAVSGQFYGWIAGLGIGVKILSPQHVVDGFKTYLTDVIAGYEDQGDS
ncbi:MAG: WYL domain-containing protein, partial [Firmicutes bacterium]|nr:WYL domain-containing protein [Bacillota bacterium]